MSRPVALIGASTLMVVSSIVAGCALRKHAQERREANYQSALRSYSEVIKPGMTRKEVEDYFKGKNSQFRQMCCVGDERTAFSDLVWIAKEHGPWYCESHEVFVAFQFSSAEPHKLAETHDSDILREITIFHWLQGCP